MSNAQREAWLAVDKAEREYLALRDAKSNGCCVGMSIVGVLIYDSKIEKAAAKVRELQEEYLKLCRQGEQ